MGALVALDVAVSSPDRVLSVVLGGTGVHSPAARGDFERQADLLERDGPSEGRETAIALAALLRSLRILDDQDVRRLRVPVAALIGAQDRFMPSVQRLSRLLPSTEVAVIPGANHATAPEHPKFAEALLAFLLKQRDITSSRNR
jgi:pimeloyl-ACP methyl ester carboxylesterase